MLSLYYKGRAVHDYDEVDDEEPTYDDDDDGDGWIIHTDPRYDDINDGWPDPGPMISDKMDLEADFLLEVITVGIPMDLI